MYMHTVNGTVEEYSVNKSMNFFFCITLGWKIQHYFCINDLFIGEDLPL